MKLHDQQEFLRDLLEGESLSALRQDSLQQGLAAVRRKRRRQVMARSAVLMTLPLLICVLLAMNRFYYGHQTKMLGPGSVVSSAPATDRGIKIINDEELFALFPNRSMALVGKPGHQQLVFLDQAQN